MWISVKDRLPEESKPMEPHFVMAWFEWGPRREKCLLPQQIAEISVGHWRPIGCNGDFDEYVTHWQPLPSPPEE